MIFENVDCAISRQLLSDFILFILFVGVCRIGFTIVSMITFS